MKRQLAPTFMQATPMTKALNLKLGVTDPAPTSTPSTG